MRILITGSRNWNDVETMIEVLSPYNITRDVKTLVHGGASGADIIAGEIAAEFGWCVEEYPADWQAHGKAAGPIRNQKMVDLGADVCLAFPLGESRGTRHCMKSAEKAGIKVINHGDEE